MKKSSFIASVLGSISSILFALGMCMVLLPEWEAAGPGVVFGCMGLLLGLVTLIIWRKMERKKPIRFSFKTIAVVAAGVIGALTLGVGMCFSMVWEKMLIGIVIGIIGITILLCLIPLVKGIKDC